MTIAGVIIALLGVVSLIYGLVSFNSLEAQLSTALGGGMNPGLIWIIVGAVLLIIGIVIVVIKSKKE